ncbi:MAG: hypothetical protein KAT77_00345 [Nanoarchaeota archaeon]|nr:hypothetical protein [Nanoarchaeota archaeon]
MNLKDKIKLIEVMDIDLEAKKDIILVLTGEKEHCAFYLHNCDLLNTDNTFYLAHDSVLKTIRQLSKLTGNGLDLDLGTDNFYQNNTRGSCLVNLKILRPKIHRTPIFFGQDRDTISEEFWPLRNYRTCHQFCHLRENPQALEYIQEVKKSLEKNEEAHLSPGN